MLTTSQLFLRLRELFCLYSGYYPRSRIFKMVVIGTNQIDLLNLYYFRVNSLRLAGPQILQVDWHDIISILQINHKKEQNIIKYKRKFVFQDNNNRILYIQEKDEMIHRLKSESRTIISSDNVCYLLLGHRYLIAQAKDSI